VARASRALDAWRWRAAAAGPSGSTVAQDRSAASARWTFLHIVAETAQHAGHADIIREALDGQRTMG
jgi:hypothetical protein